MPTLPQSLTPLFLSLSVESNNWAFKLALYIVLVISMFVMPTEFYTGYVETARIISGFFLLAQIILNIDMVILWQEQWLERSWEKGILAVSAFAYICSGVIMGLLFHWFGGDGCGLENFFIGFTIALTLIVTAATMRIASRMMGLDEPQSDGER